MSTFGDYLRRLRLDRDYGLRSFATLIDEYPSNLSAVETGGRLPWKGEKLVQVAVALGLRKNSVEWDKLFLLANQDPNLSPRMKKAFGSTEVLQATRLLSGKRLSEDQLAELEAFIKEL